MSDKPSSSEASVIMNELLAYIKKQAPQAEVSVLLKLAQQYYDRVALDDLQARSIKSLYVSLLSHWQLLKQRKKDELKIKIFTPDLDTSEYHAKCTVIEVITDDMPFLVDSLRMEINREGYNIHFMIHLGGMKFKRNNEYNVEDVLPIDTALSDKIFSEAPIYIEIDRITDPYALEKLRLNLLHVLGDVREAVDDWGKMRERLEEVLLELDAAILPISPEEMAESKDFLRWLANDHFTFLGCRDYVVSGVGTRRELDLVEGSGLGILRDESHAHKVRPLASLPAAAREMALSPHVLIISKTNTKSTVHRPVYLDYIGVKRYNKQGEIVGERRFIGLYTSGAYYNNPKQIPFLRHKVAMVLQASGLLPKSHAGKTLINILETLPRDDLFQASSEELTHLAMGILQLQERQRIRLFARWDIYRRFASCLVYVPREWFNTELRQHMQGVIEKAFHATEVDFSVLFTESVLARIHFLVRTDPKTVPDVDFKELEKKLIEIGRTWRDELQSHLYSFYGEEKSGDLLQKYAKAFPASYREDFTPKNAVYDIEQLEKINEKNPLGMSFYRPQNDKSGLIQFKLFHFKDTIPLSDVLPMLENMGLRIIGERPYEIRPQNAPVVWINDFEMKHPLGMELDVDKIKTIFHEAFEKVWAERLESDGFNKLVLEAGLSWREVTVIRAIAKYLRQTGFTFSQDYMEETLAKNSSTAKILVELFKLRFDPENHKNNHSQIESHENLLKEALDKITNLDEDRIVRRFWGIIQAIIRTNYFQVDQEGQAKTYLSFKLNSGLVPELPLPHPLYEVFVYSPRFEGIHLRAAKVARGGIRWSDRREDFRTEVLGLMKAQKVKNAVIVPSGAKGGFVPKRIPLGSTREQIQEEGIICYKQFISGLLDITDNLVEGHIEYPPSVVRYDDDDPYLVVAADKGTATFSDIANAISEKYHFWLGDAFASGGKTGYDHKKMAITAKGAWESAMRHFRELDVNIQTTDFTVVGIGDMAGDVFGNGMLLSKHIRLVAAFNHAHIFLDPNPDSASSFVERERLFHLPRSSWEDYNVNLISKGGGVYPRSAKSIPLSKEVQDRLDFHVPSATPNEVMLHILKAKVDLLFNGGIGTYVKAPQESNNEVGDHANDAIRVNGQELGCRVVVEGGNLGCTQLGRVNFELHGGILNTDFIDNSAGVDCSDHEVNAKILLNAVMNKGLLKEKERNELLAQMTDDVSRLVLRDNYLQTQAISLEKTHAIKDMELYNRYINYSEAEGKIDRVIEFLPDDTAMKERKLQGKGLTRPEIAVLLAYSKAILKEDILTSAVLNEPYFFDILTTAFPAVLSERYREEMDHHGLRCEIIATQISNFVVNEMGVTFVYRLKDETGASVHEIVRAYMVARKIFDLPKIWSEIEALDTHISAQIQLNMMYEVSRLVRRATRWFLHHRRAGLNIEETIAHFEPAVAEIKQALPVLLTGEDFDRWNEMMEHYKEQGVSESLALNVSSARFLLSSLDIIEVAGEFKPVIVATLYFMLGHSLDLGWFREQINDYPVETHWDA
ncbi:MAG: NAD-glutamate dehydrogenase, partial [Gammaproteobacteria bacterium]|nr:NAD-glutamate dehydrogenase [Gammaproteobacteria bacterium]